MHRDHMGDVLSLDVGRSPLTVRMIYDDEGENENENVDIKPAAGLLGVYRRDPSATWLVVACDYPFLTTAALRLLRRESDAAPAPVTCFANAEGFNERLLAI